MSILSEVIALDAPKKPRILVYDIETTPIRGWAWRPYKTDLFNVDQDSYVLCYAYKWLGNKTINYVGLNQKPGYDPSSTDDSWVVS